MSPEVSRKRPRTPISEHARFGLAELFGYRQQNENLPNICKAGPARDTMKESCCTFRIDQRPGGGLTQHYGEEKVLIFSSNQRGAVAKIVFSSERPDENSNCSTHKKSVSAKIHSLSVKQAYRGYGLGRLLFSMAMSLLSDRYLNETSCDALENREHSTHEEGLCVECSLEAEEDVRRHDKLVNFYTSCGCHVKPNAKISYINNNDGETYRRIPMQITLVGKLSQKSPPARCAWAKFLPIDFFSAHHERVRLMKETIPLDWFVLETDDNVFEFRSTDGCLLQVGKDGCCTVTNGRSIKTPSSQFQFQQATQTQASKANLHCGPKDLCSIKSKSGQFLGIDPVHHYFFCSGKPSYWQTDECKRSLVCVQDDSPARRKHYLQLSTFQTQEYGLRKRERYFRFDIGRFTLKDALDLAGDIQGNEFGEERCDRSLRSLLYATAEECRRSEFPDWFQLVGHGLATVLRSIDPEVAKETIEEGYDWTLCSQSGLVGSNRGEPTRSLQPNLKRRGGVTPANKNASVVEKRVRHDRLENCGNVLSWTGPEYMYNMLKHNGVELPEEAYLVLRLFAVNDSERQQCSKALAASVDNHALCVVQDFCSVREIAKQTLFSTQEYNEIDCTSLWNSHFSRIVEKYGAEKQLQW